MDPEERNLWSFHKSPPIAADNHPPSDSTESRNTSIRDVQEADSSSQDDDLMTEKVELEILIEVKKAQLGYLDEKIRERSEAAESTRKIIQETERGVIKNWRTFVGCTEDFMERFGARESRLKDLKEMKAKIAAIQSAIEIEERQETERHERKKKLEERLKKTLEGRRRQLEDLQTEVEKYREQERDLEKLRQEKDALLQCDDENSPRVVQLKEKLRTEHERCANLRNRMEHVQHQTEVLKNTQFLAGLAQQRQTLKRALAPWPIQDIDFFHPENIAGLKEVKAQEEAAEKEEDESEDNVRVQRDDSDEALVALDEDISGQTEELKEIAEITIPQNAEEAVIEDEEVEDGIDENTEEETFDENTVSESESDDEPLEKILKASNGEPVNKLNSLSSGTENEQAASMNSTKEHWSGLQPSGLSRPTNEEHSKEIMNPNQAQKKTKYNSTLLTAGRLTLSQYTSPRLPSGTSKQAHEKQVNTVRGHANQAPRNQNLMGKLNISKVGALKDVRNLGGIQEPETQRTLVELQQGNIEPTLQPRSQSSKVTIHQKMSISAHVGKHYYKKTTVCTREVLAYPDAGLASSRPFQFPPINSQRNQQSIFIPSEANAGITSSVQHPALTEYSLNNQELSPFPAPATSQNPQINKHSSYNAETTPTPSQYPEVTKYSLNNQELSPFPQLSKSQCSEMDRHSFFSPQHVNASTLLTSAQCSGISVYSLNNPFPEPGRDTHQDQLGIGNLRSHISSPFTDTIPQTDFVPASVLVKNRQASLKPQKRVSFNFDYM